MSAVSAAEVRKKAAEDAQAVWLETTSTGCCNKEEAYMLNQSVAVVRHGERMDHEPQRWKDHPERLRFPNDTPLTEEGFRHAREVGRKLKAYSELSGRPAFSCIVCSPYLRCAQTACCIAESLPLRIRFDLDLGEIFDGVAMVGDVAEKRQHRPPSVLESVLRLDFPEAQFVRDENSDIVISNEHKLPAFPESFDAARMRFCIKVHKIVRQATSELVSAIVVTHGDCVSAVLGMLYQDKQVVKVPMAGYALGNRSVKVLNKAGNTVQAQDVYGAKWDFQLSPGIVLKDASAQHMQKSETSRKVIRDTVSSSTSSYNLSQRQDMEEVMDRMEVSSADADGLIKTVHSSEFLNDPERQSFAGPGFDESPPNSPRQSPAAARRTSPSEVAVVPRGPEKTALAKQKFSAMVCQWLCAAFS